MKHRRPPMREVKEFEEEVIQIDRVTRVVKGGRRLRFRATVVIGNKKGKVGVGIGKSTEVTGAISKAIANAKKDMIEVPMAGQTITHKVSIKFKSAKILLMPAIPGTGIKAGGSVRKVIELAGIKDIMGKCLGSPNRLNNSQATIKALMKLKKMPWLKVETPATAKEQPAAAQRRPNPRRRFDNKRGGGQNHGPNNRRPDQSRGQNRPEIKKETPATPVTPVPTAVKEEKPQETKDKKEE
jgi:small subunit ribosomal protein S5